MRSKSSFSAIIFIVIFGIGLAFTSAAYNVDNPAKSIIIAAVSFIIALLVSLSIRIANPWDKAVVLRLGNFQSLRGPGLFFIIPILDTTPIWIDTRVITTSFKAEKTLTKDT